MEWLIAPWFFRKKLEETEKQFHGHKENEKMPGEKASFLQPAFFSFSRMHSIRLAAICQPVRGR